MSSFKKFKEKNTKKEKKSAIEKKGKNRIGPARHHHLG
jgi:hypothetical protein